MLVDFIFENEDDIDSRYKLEYLEVCENEETQRRMTAGMVLHPECEGRFWCGIDDLVSQCSKGYRHFPLWNSDDDF